jgi:hypothetical protein
MASIFVITSQLLPLGPEQAIEQLSRLRQSLFQAPEEIVRGGGGKAGCS